MLSVAGPHVEDCAGLDVSVGGRQDASLDHIVYKDEIPDRVRRYQGREAIPASPGPRALA